MFDSTALLGVLRPFRQMSNDRDARSFWLCRSVELLADWVFIVALLVAIYALTASTAIVALFMLVRLIPRAIVVILLHNLAERIDTRRLFWLSLPRVPLIASLALVNVRSDLLWAGAVVFCYGLLTALSNEARATLLPQIVPRRRLSDVTQLNAAIERIAFVAGPLLTTFVLWIWNVEIALLVSATLLAAASLLLGYQSRLSPATTRAWAVADHTHLNVVPLGVVLRQPTLFLMAGGLFAGAALALATKVVLIELVTEPLDQSETMFPFTLAAVGVGMLVGPLSVPRLLGNLPLSMVVSGAAIGIAAGLALISVVTRWEIVVVVLLGLGMISITNDAVTATAIRRVAPEADLHPTDRLMMAAVIAGQLFAALAVGLLAIFWDAASILLVGGIAVALLMGGLFVAADGVTPLTRRLAR